MAQAFFYIPWSLIEISLTVYVDLLVFSYAVFVLLSVQPTIISHWYTCSHFLLLVQFLKLDLRIFYLQRVSSLILIIWPEQISMFSVFHLDELFVTVGNVRDMFLQFFCFGGGGGALVYCPNSMPCAFLTSRRNTAQLRHCNHSTVLIPVTEGT
jgi:hypothetical protein